MSVDPLTAKFLSFTNNRLDDYLNMNQWRTITAVGSF